MSEASRLGFVGPFDTRDVVFRGRRVSFLGAIPQDGGGVHLVLDRRFGLDLTVQQAELVVPFIAHAIAVAQGFTCHPDADQEPTRRLPFPRMAPLFTEGAPDA